jgi:hypothetical protein
MKHNQTHPSYRDLGGAPFGSKCVKCGLLGMGRRLFEFDGRKEVLHSGCIEQFRKDMAGGPEPLPEGSAPQSEAHP